MKKKLLLFIFVFIFFVGFSQNNSEYKKIYKFDEYQKNWALVKSKTGNYGMIDRNGKEIIPTIYAEIKKFGEIEKDLALVKSIAGNYGMIDRNGKEIIPTIYTYKQIKSRYYKKTKKLSEQKQRHHNKKYSAFG